jgi:hypothetical protein
MEVERNKELMIATMLLRMGGHWHAPSAGFVILVGVVMCAFLIAFWPGKSENK